MTLTVMIVDDEPLARRRVIRLLHESPEVTVVAEAPDGPSALRRLGQDPAIDVMILDIEMPGLDGFSLLDRCDPTRRPAVIFVTAHAEHALRAFDARAVHYVLKPVEPARLREAIVRVIDGSRRPADPSRGFAATLPVTMGPKLVPLPVQDIRWIEAAGNYVRLHCAAKTWLHRATIEAIARELAPAEFVRIHRSTIVAVRAVAWIKPRATGDYDVCLTDGHVVRLSRSRRAVLARLLRGTGSR